MDALKEQRMSLRTECQEADQPKMQRPRVHVARPLALPSDSSTTIYTDSDEYLFEPLRSVDILNEEATNDSPVQPVQPPQHPQTSEH